MEYKLYHLKWEHLPKCTHTHPTDVQNLLTKKIHLFTSPVMHLLLPSDDLPASPLKYNTHNLSLSHVQHILLSVLAFIGISGTGIGCKMQIMTQERRVPAPKWTMLLLSPLTKSSIFRKPGFKDPLLQS